ncbi:MAG TPA: hypothetical protein DHU65_06425 [Clostridiales bacterium]|nr:hypothetical protein [Clostridiales bacterium]
MAKQMNTERRRRFGDRYDGWKIRGADPFFKLIPHIMHKRNDAQVFFDETIEINGLEKFIRTLRQETDMKDLGMLEVLIAAFVRMISQYPCVNRFVSGRNIYARNTIEFSFTLKREMTLEGVETTVKIKFDPTDTLHDVWEKIRREISDNKGMNVENDTDVLAKVLSMCPTFLLKFIIFLMDKLDHVGLMPKFIHEFSPFHTSVFLTDMGSTGLGSVFHHIYNFGTCSVFCCLGKKGRKLKLNDEGKVVHARTLNLRFVVDERICDGYYFAMTIRDLIKLLKKPEALLSPPEQVVADPGLPLTRKEKRVIRKRRRQEKKDADQQVA